MDEMLCARRRKRITIELNQLDRARHQATPCEPALDSQFKREWAVRELYALA
jgi:hypothetical protein